MAKLKRILSGTAGFLYFLLGGSGGWAQVQLPDLSQMQLEDLVKVQVDTVSGASKFLEKSTEVPASITIVTAEEIREFGYRTLADVLRSVRGFQVMYDRNYSYVGIRGFLAPGDYNARILFLLDGHRVNDNIYDGAYVGTGFPVDINLIDRIEIVRGASSSVYGTGALLAVINVITKRGRDVGGVDVTASAGSLRTYKGQASYGTRFDNGMELLLAGTEYGSHGNASLFFPEFDSPQTNLGIAQDADRDRSASVFADVIYRDFNIHVVENSRTKQVPTASFGTVFDDPRTQTTDARGYLDMQYSHSVGKWELIGRGSYDWYSYHGAYIYDYTNSGPPFTENADLAKGAWSNFEFDASRRLFDRHRITFGGEFRKDFTQKQINYDLSPYVLYLDQERPEESVGVYAQDEFRVGSDLSLVGGVRLDWHDTVADDLSPRIGLLYSPAESTHLKLMYGQAFRVPNAYELYYVSNISNTASTTLKSEQVHTLEVEIEHRLYKNYDLITSIYGNRFHDLIDLGSNPAIGRLPNTNSSEVLHSNGFEFQLDASWARGMKGQLSYALQSSRYFPGGLTARNSPSQIAKARLLVPVLQKRLSAAFDGWYTGRLLTISGVELGGYLVANATLLAQNLHKNFDLSLSVYNLFNKYYADPGGYEHREASIPQDGRTARIQLSYRFFSKTR